MSTQAEALLRKAAVETPDRKVVFRQTIYTTVGGHHMAGDAVLAAKLKGLDATVETSGGWFSKTHLIIIQGACSRALEWFDQVSRWS